MPITLLASLSDDQLLAEAHRLVASERRATAALIRLLIELDTRRLYLREGSSSLFTYCTQVLHLSEGAAYNRIETARAARRFPRILAALEEGSLTLTAVRLLAPHLTPENHRDVLAAARQKSKREIELLAATLNPKPTVSPTVRKLPERRNASSAPVLPAIGNEVSTSRSAETRPDSGSSSSNAETQSPRVVAPTVRGSTPRAAVTPLAPERYKVQLTISGETHNKLRRVQDLLRHTIPDGDLSAIFDRALTLLLEDLERRRCAATPSPRPARGATPRSRHIPAAVRRQVWQRDEGRCTFIGRQGRCGETGFLEFHHEHPYAAGGPPTVENISLRCRRHNQHEASLFFGCDGYEFVREVAP